MNEQEQLLRDRVRARLVNALNQLKRDMASEGYATEHLTVEFVFDNKSNNEPLFTFEEAMAIGDHLIGSTRQMMNEIDSITKIPPKRPPRRSRK